MPRQRAPFDYDRYETLSAQGLSKRAIAKEMALPEATLRDNLKILEHVKTQGKPLVSLGGPETPAEGLPDVSIGTPYEQAEGIPKVSLSTHSSSGQCIPEVSLGGPPLYIHPGIPDDSEESPVGGEDIEGVHQGIPALPHLGTPQGYLGTPQDTLSPHLVAALTAAWPDFQEMLAWWKGRRLDTQEATAPGQALERATFHVQRRYIEAIKREAAVEGATIAAIVNRAFRKYFTGR
jgi:hypothetical protein